nr:putative ribonuclease h protein [Quercus suber]
MKYNVWAATLNGLFIVRSAYKLAMEESRSSNRGSSSNPSKTCRFWKRLWSLQVPHKVRPFTWRACKSILPTKENLVRRAIQLNVGCEECKEEVEFVGHILWSCSRAKEVWPCTKMKFHFDQTRVNSFHDLLWQILMTDSFEEEGTELVVIVAWALWSNRNKVRHGGRKKSAVALFQWSRQYLQEFHEASQMVPNTVMPRVVGWSPPPRS